MLTYARLAKEYANFNRQQKPPKGFKLHCEKKGGVRDPNTCAVRLAYSIFLCDKTFFGDVEAKSKTEWYGLPSVASDLAIILNQKIGKAERVDRSAVLKRTGIIFFDTITGYNASGAAAGSGHISLWDGMVVVDMEGAPHHYFDKSPRAYFWDI
jgi:hypothetical protein